MIHNLSIWGHALEMEDVASSESLPMIAIDMEHDFPGCRELNPPPKSVIDLGANVGAFCIPMAKHYPDAWILAIEPLENNMTALIKNILMNRVQESVMPLCRAVSNVKGKTHIFQHPRNSGSASSFNPIDYMEHIVECTTLDDIVASTLRITHLEKIDLLKMDIEGAEYLAFNNFTIWDKIGKVTIEMHKVNPFTDEQNKQMAEGLLELLFTKLGKENVCAITQYSSKYYLWGKELERTVLEGERLSS